MLNEIKSLLKKKQEQIALQESTEVLENEINSLNNLNNDFLESVLILNEETLEESAKKKKSTEDKKEPELAEEECEEECSDFKESDDFNDEIVDESELPEMPESEEESGDDPMEAEVSEEESEETKKDEPNEETPEETETDTKEDENETDSEPSNDLDDEPVDDAPENDEIDTEPEENEDELDNQPTYDDDELPEPVGRNTDEPVQNSDNVILSTEIDISTGTPRDVLPIPPAGAVDAIASNDQMSQRVDSGFADDEPDEDENENDDEFHDVKSDDIVGSPVVDYGANGNDDSEDEESEEESTPPEENTDNDFELESFLDQPIDENIFMEEINIGNPPAGNEQQPTDSNQQQNTEAPADANVTPADTTGTGGTPETPPEEDSPVTKEVLDQVNGDNTGADTTGDAGLDLGTPPEVTDDSSTTDTTSDVPTTDTSVPATGDQTVDGSQAEKIFKKLSTITKDVEDAKTQVLQMLNKNQ